MNVVALILMVIASIFALLIITGLFLKRNFEFERSIIIHADKRIIYDHISNLKHWTEWSAWSKNNDDTLEFNFDESKPDEYDIMSWDGKRMGKGKMEIKEAKLSKILIDINFNRRKFTLHNLFELIRMDDQTKIIWKVTGKTGRSAPAKIFGLLFPKWMGKDMETGLVLLKRMCESR